MTDPKPLGGMTFTTPEATPPGFSTPPVPPQPLPSVPPELLEWGRAIREDLAAIRALLEKDAR